MLKKLGKAVCSKDGMNGKFSEKSSTTAEIPKRMCYVPCMLLTHLISLTLHGEVHYYNLLYIHFTGEEI